MTEEQVIALLRSIYILSTLPYPWPDDAKCDVRLALAVGEIRRITNIALSAVGVFQGTAEDRVGDLLRRGEHE